MSRNFVALPLAVVLLVLAASRAGHLPDGGGRAPADPAVPVDCFGDPLPEGAVARLGTLRLRHGGGVYAVCFARDGKTLVSYGGDDTFRTWDVTTGRELDRRQRLGPSLRRCDDAVFSPDGSTLALAGRDQA